LVVAAGFVLALGGTALVYLFSVPHQEPVAPGPAPTPSLQASAASVMSATAASASAVASAPSAPPDELGPGDDVPPGYGLIVVTAPSGARVRLDGAIAGIGPVSAVAAPGYHDVRVEGEGKEAAVQVLEVRAGKAIRWSPTPAP
jgi:hypothetical protein